jgi:hypothetical protein
MTIWGSGHRAQKAAGRTRRSPFSVPIAAPAFERGTTGPLMDLMLEEATDE